MKLAHLSDMHLGLRQHQRLAANCINQREMDCANAFRHAVDGVLAARPDLVVLAGDLFHSSLPTPASITFAFRQIKRLRDARLPVVCIAGNHDSPRKRETGSIFPLLRELLDVQVATDDAMEFAYPALDLTVTAVPDTALRCGGRNALEPHGTARYRVLVMHGEVEGVYRRGSSGLREAAPISAAAMQSEAWSYVALGDYHTCHQVGPRAWYSGATEYASPNIWGELQAEGAPGKVWLLADLETGTVERQPIPLARMLYDLEPIDAIGMEAQEVDVLIAERLAQQDITDALVRLRVFNIPQPVRRDLAHRMIRDAKARALNLNLDCRPPEKGVCVGDTVRPGRFKSITETLVDYLGRRELTPGIERERLTETARALMVEIDDAKADRSPEAEAQPEGRVA